MRIKEAICLIFIILHNRPRLQTYLKIPNLSQMSNPINLDQTDLKIINILLQDAKTPYAEIGKILFISPGTVHVRIKKLIESGIIKGTSAIIDHQLLGYDILAYLGVYLEKSGLSKNVGMELKKIPEVISADYTTGVYSLFVKVRCKDTKHLKEVLSKKIQAIGGIHRTETFISLESSIDRPLTLPVIENDQKSKDKGFNMISKIS